MKFTYLYLVSSLVFIGLFTEAQAAPQAGAATAAISKIDGEGIAKVRRKSGVESVAGVKQELFAGDRITTDARSIVEIMLADGTLVRVGLNSEYRLESVQKKSGIFTWVFGLAKGSIRAMVEKNPKKNMVKFRVNTPVGTMGVRGTELVLDHNEKAKRTTLYTIEGRVEFGVLGCYLKRKCIEVKTGETASVGAKPDEQQPVARPTDVAALLLMGNPKGAKGVKDGDGAKEGEQASVEAATAEERLARAALFTDLKKADALAEKAAGSIDATSKGDVDEIVKAASEAMADAQDKLLGRTKAQREQMHEAIKDGSYADRLKLAEKFDDIRDGSGGKGKDREKENLNANAVNKKLSLADAILKSKKMRLALEKRAAMDNSLIEAKLKAAKAKLNDARAKVGLSEVELTTDTATSTATSSTMATNYAVATSSATETAVEAEEEVSPEEVKEANQVLDKSLADGILSSRIDYQNVINYSYQQTDCFLFMCTTSTKTGKESLESIKTAIIRKSGECYETKTHCQKKMIPCKLTNGKSCKPTFENLGCTTERIKVDCSTTLKRRSKRDGDYDY